MKKETIGTIALLLATLLWGMTFAFIRDAVSVISPFNFLFWRFGVASILLFIICFRIIKIKNTELLLRGLWLGIFLGGTVIFQTIGLRYTTASTAAFITGLSVILVTLFVCILNKQWPRIEVVIASILAVGGIGLITLTRGMAINQGDLWVLLCAICFAIYIILVGKYSERGNALTLTFIQTAIICSLSGLLDITTGGAIIPTELRVWIAIIFCAVFASVIAFFLQLQFQRYVDPNKAAIIFALEPVFATITAAIYLGEKLNMQFAIGAVMICAAILLSEMSSKKKILPQD